jgi:anti-anti-sigma regulatory factor
MSSHKLRIKAYYHERSTYIKISGIIDEDNHLSALLNQYLSGDLVIDCSEVERINSYGARDWLTWVASVAEPGQLTVLVGCSLAVISQLNIFHNFAGRGVIKSFYAPYFCLECTAEKRILLAPGDVSAALEPPLRRCDECEQVLEFDDMPEVYFSFLQGRPPAPDLEHIDHILAELQTSGGVPALSRRRANTSGIWHYSVPSLPRLSRPATIRDSAKDARPGSDPIILIAEELGAESNAQTSLGLRPAQPAPRPSADEPVPLGLRDTMPLPLQAPRESPPAPRESTPHTLPPPMRHALPASPEPAPGRIRRPYVLAAVLIGAALLLALGALL